MYVVPSIRTNVMATASASSLIMHDFNWGPYPFRWTLSAMEFRKSESDLRRENAQASRRFLYPAGPWNSSQNRSPRGGASSGGLELDSHRTKMRKNEFLFTHTQTCVWNNNNNNTDNISC